MMSTQREGKKHQKGGGEAPKGRGRSNKREGQKQPKGEGEGEGQKHLQHIAERQVDRSQRLERRTSHALVDHVQRQQLRLLRPRRRIHRRLLLLLLQLLLLLLLLLHRLLRQLRRQHARAAAVRVGAHVQAEAARPSLLGRVRARRGLQHEE